MNIQVKVNDALYTVQIDDVHARPVIAIVEGEQFEVWPEEVQAQSPEIQSVKSVSTIASPPKKAPQSTGANSTSINAPLPGVIVSIEAKAGDKIKVGQALCTLEAMKMKNAIRSNREGVIAEVLISVGDQVQHGQTLLRFEA